MSRSVPTGHKRASQSVSKECFLHSSDGATLCRWFGIAEGDLPYVFPNIGAFANTNLGFMS